MATCLYCNREFVSRHPTQKFCGKNKSGRHLCKDRYHNRARWPETVARLTGEASPEPGSYDEYLDSVHPFSSEGLGQWND